MLAPDFTEQQTKVLLKLSSTGGSNKEIAQALGLAEGTVKLHIQHICRKLGTDNRTKVALWGADNGYRKKENA